MLGGRDYISAELNYKLPIGDELNNKLPISVELNNKLPSTDSSVLNTFDIININMFKSLFNIISLQHDNDTVVIKFVDHMFKNNKPPDIEVVINSLPKDITINKRYKINKKTMIDIDIKTKIELLWIDDNATSTSTDMFMADECTENTVNLYLQILSYVEKFIKINITTET